MVKTLSLRRVGGWSGYGSLNRWRAAAALQGLDRSGGSGCGRLSGVAGRRCIRGSYNGPIVGIVVRTGVDVIRGIVGIIGVVDVSVPVVIVVDSVIIRGRVVVCGIVVCRGVGNIGVIDRTAVIIVNRRIHGAYAGKGLDMRRYWPGSRCAAALRRRVDPGTVNCESAAGHAFTGRIAFSQCHRP